MLYETFCGLNVNLIIAGVVVAIIDILSIVFEIYVDLQFYQTCEFLRILRRNSQHFSKNRQKIFSDDKFHLIAFSIFSVAILCAVLLIHGALTVCLHSRLFIY